MPTRIIEPDRIVPHIRIPIQILRIGVIGNHAVGRDEAPQRGIVIAGVVPRRGGFALVEQAEAVEPLAGEVVVAGVETAAPIFAAIRVEAELVVYAAALIGC